MACRSIRTLLCCGVALAAISAPARAEEPTPAPKKMRTVLVNECVEEKYQTTRTAYRVEYKPVVCESFRHETVCEPREQLVTVVKRIPEYRTETRRVCHNEVCYEDRVVMKRCYETRQVTECVKKCVSKGHWECRTECAPPSCLDKLLHGCDACGHERTKKVWVHCPQYVDCPVTRCVKVCVEKPTVCKVKVCKPVFKEVQVQTCSYRCVEEKVVQKCMVSVCRKVACQVVHQERTCVPYQETVWCTRLVQKQREVQVEEVQCCTTPCTPCCDPCCPRSCGGLRLRQHSCCR